ncbi:hypothetical protein [Hansschlegelia sp. KR7-227]|jgi:hypothetical protein|uniref:hypothetical protein n=1 Tax=Hansschlegelia sp. KR7-227 TaxID=3400914 RepID=UPI003C0A6E6E
MMDQTTKQTALFFGFLAAAMAANTAAQAGPTPPERTGAAASVERSAQGCEARDPRLGPAAVAPHGRPAPRAS